MSIINKELLHGDISHDMEIIPDTVTENGVQISIILFSNKFNTANVQFEYRLDAGPWLSDANIYNLNQGKIIGSEITDLRCSPDGFKNIFIWNFHKNGLSEGQAVDVKARVYPNMRCLTSDSGGTILETIGYNRNISKSDLKIVGINNYGREIAIAGNAVVILDNGIAESSFSVTSPEYVLQMPNDNYMIVRGDQYISEFDIEGNEVKSINNAGLINGVVAVDYDKDLESVLFASPLNEKIYELSFKDWDLGSILWEYGSGATGSGLNEFESPNHAIYGPGNVRFVHVADLENNRVVIIDRVLGSASAIEQIEIEETQIDIYKPAFLTRHNGSVWFAESQQEYETFNENIDLHPALMRYKRSNGATGVSGKNGTLLYSNLMFRPVMGVK